MSNELQILSKNLLEDFQKNVPDNVPVAFKNLTDAEISTDSFSFYVSANRYFSYTQQVSTHHFKQVPTI